MRACVTERPVSVRACVTERPVSVRACGTRDGVVERVCHRGPVSFKAYALGLCLLSVTVYEGVCG